MIDLYIESSQPIGSKTLMESSFQELSSATIRNYFASLERYGFLSQQHISGGRVPTERAYKAYADEFFKDGTIDEKNDKELLKLAELENKEVGSYLQKACELLSELSGFPIFISSPRFDHDFVVDIKLVMVDNFRLLCAVITELGLIHTEILYLEEKLNHHALKRIEDVILSRIKGQESTTRLEKKDDFLAQKIYNEIMVRYIIGYANFSLEDIYTTGLSRLLAFPEFNNAEAFASGLALFENKDHLRRLFKESCKDKTLKYFIGEDLLEYCPLAQDCSVITLPYAIGGKVVGAIGVLGPLRMPYRKLFGLLRAFSEYVSDALTKSMVKYKLTYRTPTYGAPYLENNNQILLEDQSQ